MCGFGLFDLIKYNKNCGVEFGQTNFGFSSDAQGALGPPPSSSLELLPDSNVQEKSVWCASVRGKESQPLNCLPASTSTVVLSSPTVFFFNGLTGGPSNQPGARFPCPQDKHSIFLMQRGAPLTSCDSLAHRIHTSTLAWQNKRSAPIEDPTMLPLSINSALQARACGLWLLGILF